jgi:hypothetical protein
MHSIPVIKIVPLIHFFFIAAFLGLYFVEVVFELYSYFNKSDLELFRSVIRIHYWVDILVEIPLAGGIIMAVLMDHLTTLHLIKIGAAFSWIFFGCICIWNVIKRYRLLQAGSSNELLLKKSNIIIFFAVIAMSAFTLAAGIGSWLAYHRVLGSIQGGERGCSYEKYNS